MDFQFTRRGKLLGQGLAGGGIVDALRAGDGRSTLALRECSDTARRGNGLWRPSWLRLRDRPLRGQSNREQMWTIIRERRFKAPPDFGQFLARAFEIGAPLGLINPVR